MANTQTGLCECGCGERTPLAMKTYADRGIRKGQPNRFIFGHNSRVMKTRSDEAAASQRRRCSKCGIEKPFGQFYKHKGQRTGRQSSCIACHYARGLKESGGVFTAAAREIKRLPARQKPPQLSAWRRKASESPEFRSMSVEKVQRRNARLRAVSTEKVDYRKIIERDRMICHICRRKIRSYRQIHFDHVIPLAKGGAHVETNIALSHAKCNLSKSVKVLSLF